MLTKFVNSASRYFMLTIFYTCFIVYILVKNEQVYKVVTTPIHTYSIDQLSEFMYLSKRNSVNLLEEKTLVLIWTDYYEIKGDRILEKYIHPARKWDKDCCSGSVEVTTNKNLLEKSTSVVFFGYHGNLDIKTMPKNRPNGQIWVLFLKESPIYTPALFPYKNIFNWTMSYRKDSDIWAPYGEFVALTPPLSPSQAIQMPGNISLNEWIHKKTKLIAWVSSNCKTRSRREMFKTALENEGPNIIDVFGSCRGFKRICNRRSESCNHTKFWHELAQNYHFYFAAENSLCVDYITEKFWRSLAVGIVPVVYGGADYENVAPPNSYIDVRQFKSPKELVEYLKKIASDEKLYGKYFEWKRNYKVQSTDCWKGWCELCRRTKLQNDKPLKIGVHSDLSNWWTKWPIKNINGSSSHKKSACFKGPLIVS